MGGPSALIQRVAARVATIPRPAPSARRRGDPRAFEGINVLQRLRFHEVAAAATISRARA